MTSSPERSEHRPRGASSAVPIALRDPSWAFVQVCMHCDAVVFVELPSGWRFWVPAASDAARVLRQGPLAGPRPVPSHGICQPCVRRHYAELLPMLRARYPASNY